MLDAPRRAVIPEAPRQTPRHLEPTVDLPQQQHASVRRQPTAVEPAHHPTTAQAFKIKLRRNTLWLHGAIPWSSVRS